MAQSAVSLRVDTREFKQALRQILATDKKGWAYVLNDQGIRFCKAAIAETKAADPSQIEATLGRQQTASKVFTKKGQRRKKAGKVYGPWENTFAARIVNKRRKTPIFGKELNEAARKLVAARKRSVGYIKAGWIPPIKQLAAAQGGRGGGGGKGAKVMGRGHGSARPAKPSINPFALIRNFVKDVTKSSFKEGNAVSIAKQSAQRAVTARVSDMKRKLIERMNRDHKKHQGRRI